MSKRVRVSCLEGHFKDFGDLGQVGSKMKLTKNQKLPKFDDHRAFLTDWWKQLSFAGTPDFQLTDYRQVISLR